MENKIIYFPGLNGLRAIAAIAVVVSHITFNLSAFNLPSLNSRGLDLAGYGVSVFFVLSGFLITYLLQAEKNFQPINVVKFYFRRILRIWPLYYLYLIITVVTILFLGLELNTKALSQYVFYAANVPFIMGTELPFLAHYWSLGVEEQFYLFWPWINKKFKSLGCVILVLIFGLVGLKIILHLAWPNSLLETIIHVSRFHCMMIGGLGALLYKKENVLFLRFTDNKITQVFCWVILFLIAINKYHIASVLDNEIISVVALCLIIGQIKIKNRLINLDVGIMDFLGKISYGIYVMHPLVIFLFSKLLFGFELYAPLKYTLVYLTVISTTILLSYLSYTYFERYFLKYKKRFEVIKSAASRNFE